MDSSTWTDAQALGYIASYADLRLVLGADPQAGRLHFASVGEKEGRSITFDPYAYLATYSDLRTAYGKDTAAAASHFINFGASEGRSINFDGYAYLASYADLRAVFGTDVTAAIAHYVEFGAIEGRTISFDGYSYLASYADLRAVFGTDVTAATAHYVQFGASEGRTISFDAYGYLATYPDLRVALANDPLAAVKHYVQLGAAEGRTVTFDALGYIASYADLAILGNNTAGATRHFVLTGAAQGRVANGLQTAPSLAANSDSGITGDNVTSDFTPDVEGFAAAGSLVKIYVDGSQVGTATATSSGRWTYGVGGALADGSHVISAVVGNSDNKGTSVVVDTLDPAKASIPKISSMSDTGVLGDGRTTLTAPTLEGTAEVGSLIAIYVDGRKTATVEADVTGAWSYNVLGALSVGDHGVYVRWSDAAGNVGDRSDILNLRIQLPIDAAALTTASDDIVLSDKGGTVTATSPTLTANTTTYLPPALTPVVTPGDRLVGGAGYDTLQLFGGGEFRIDKLDAFTGFEKIMVTNPGGSSEARVFLGNQDIALGVSQGFNARFYTGSGKIDFQSEVGGSVNVGSAANWNTANVIKGQASFGGTIGTSINVAFGEYSYSTGHTYDLRSSSLSQVSINSSGTNTFLVNTATMSGVTSWSGYSSSGTTTLSVADSSINLGSTSLFNYNVVSTNTAGTTFTTSNSATAFSVQGGTGQDTLVLNGSSFTTDQRNSIFATTSVETITDASGTFRVDPNMVRLTTAADQVTTSAAGGTVIATSPTLTANTTTYLPPALTPVVTPGDRLVGGAGYDTLQLFGGGEFRIDKLDAFTGFEKIMVTNPGGSSEARVFLGNQDIALGVSQGFNARFYTGSGKIDFQSEVGGSVNVGSAANWNTANVIKGKASFGGTIGTSINVAFGEYSYSTGQTYDLRSSSLSQVSINSSGTNTFLVNTATMSGVTSWSGYSSSGTTTLSVADSSINLGSTSLFNYNVVSTNTAGTTFTTSNSATAFSVQGGTGQDTLVLNGSSFTTDQRNSIFATTSVETITDASGTFRKINSGHTEAETAQDVLFLDTVEENQDFLFSSHLNQHDMLHDNIYQSRFDLSILETVIDRGILIV